MPWIIAFVTLLPYVEIELGVLYMVGPNFGFDVNLSKIYFFEIYSEINK